ncbi:hypothetical protein ONZ45_g14144 [Pleurotus djamor]|nr:hypothetical protein ONZ45_g14144 [Pleurotus djamor]
MATYSLDDFVTEAASLQKNHDDAAEFIKFVINGISGDEEITVNPLLHPLAPDEGIDGGRDYDSLLGIDTNIQVTSSISLYPVSKISDTLSSDIHLKYNFTVAGGLMGLAVHKCPNLCIGYWGNRNNIRALLPALYREGRSSALTQQEYKQFYEKGLRPAIVELIPVQANEWPADYSTEIFRARSHAGQLSLGTKVVDSFVVEDLGDMIRSHLAANGLDWGTGLVFLHEIRGTKHGHGHGVRASSAQRVLDAWLTEYHLDKERMEASGEWYIDAGVEFVSRSNHCLAWRTDSHFHIVQSALQISEIHARRITRPGSTKYTRDMVSHMPSISGCCISPGIQAKGPFKAQYLQMYTTDKAILYRIEGYHRGKYIEPLEIFKEKDNDFVDNLYNVYVQAIHKNASLARLEVRVPLQYAESVLLTEDLRNDLIRQSLVSFDPQTFWGLRAYRAMALSYILSWQREPGAQADRGRECALILTIAAAWMLNSLHSSPDKGGSCKELIQAALPLGDVDMVDVDHIAFGSPTQDDQVDEDGVSDNEEFGAVPVWPRGLIFLRGIRMGQGTPIPRFSAHPPCSLSPRAYKYFLKMTLPQFKDKYLEVKVGQPPHPHRVHNKVTMVERLRPEAAARPLVRPFDLESEGYRLGSPVRDTGSDLDEISDADEDTLPSQLDDALDRVWKEFLVDLAQKAPNRGCRSLSSYCILDDDQRPFVTEENYIGDPRNYLDDFQFKYSTGPEWERVFNRLFPEKGSDTSSRIQGYPSTRWCKGWDKLLERLDQSASVKARKEIKRRIDEFLWLPFAQTDKIWATKPQKGKGWKQMECWGSGSTTTAELHAAPAIYINGRVAAAQRQLSPEV